MVHCITFRTDTLIGDILDGFGIMVNGIKLWMGLHKKTESVTIVCCEQNEK